MKKYLFAKFNNFSFVKSTIASVCFIFLSSWQTTYSMDNCSQQQAPAPLTEFMLTVVAQHSVTNPNVMRSVALDLLAQKPPIKTYRELINRYHVKNSQPRRSILPALCLRSIWKLMKQEILKTPTLICLCAPVVEFPHGNYGYFDHSHCPMHKDREPYYCCVICA